MKEHKSEAVMNTRRVLEAKFLEAKFLEAKFSRRSFGGGVWEAEFGCFCER